MKGEVTVMGGGCHCGVPMGCYGEGGDTWGLVVTLGGVGDPVPLSPPPRREVSGSGRGG